MKKVFALENGVRVALVPFQSTIDVGIGVVLDAGSAYETKAVNGISHLLEHVLAFHCRRFDTMETRGVVFDACTSNTSAETDQRVMRFGYETKPRHLRAAMELARDTLLRPRINRTTVDHELRRIREEEYLGNDSLEVTLIDKTMANLNQGTAGSLPILGTLDRLGALTLKDIRAWYQQFTVGHRCAVAVTGCFDAAIAERLVRRCFGSLKPGEPAPPLPYPKVRQRLRVTRRESQTVYVSLSFPVPFGFADPKRLAVSVLRNHLYGRESSRLFLQLITQTGLVYGVECSVRHTEGNGYVLINWSVHSSAMLETLGIVINETQALANGMFTQDHLHLAQVALKASARERNYDPHSQAKFYAEQLLLTGDVLSTGQFVRALSNVRVRDVRRVARSIFPTQQAILTLVGPVPKSLRRDVRNLLRANAQ